MLTDTQQNSLTRKAYAKINLSLDVTGKRPNGYHDVKMIMQTVNLYDVLTFERIPQDQLVKLNEELAAESNAKPSPEQNANLGIQACDLNEQIFLTYPEKKDIGAAKDNLIYKAAKMLFDLYGVRDGVRITLEKNIPIAAGMAGGSTDAAATLRGINTLFALGLSDEKLCELGVKLGADIPYCVMGGTYLAEGIGEILTPLSDTPDLILAIAKPEIGVSTKYVYEHLDEKADQISHPDVDAMRIAIEKKDVEKISSLLGNVLEEVTIPGYPIVGEIKSVFRKAGAKGTLMSGSGPTVFAIFDTESAAQTAILQVKEKGLADQVFVTNLYDNLDK